MDKQDFNKLNVIDQIEYVNSELKKGESLRNISSNLAMSKTTIRDRFVKYAYVFNSEVRQYMKDDNYKSIAKVLPADKPMKNKPVAVENYKSNTIVNNNDSTELQSIEDFNNIKSDLLELINNKHEILEMLKNYKSNTKVIDVPMLDINTLPEELQKDITTKSIKVYTPVYDLLDKLCKDYSSIKKQDLISLAFLEFYNRYKK